MSSSTAWWHFSSLVVGDRCSTHPSKKCEPNVIAVQNSLSKENIRNVYLNLWAIGSDKAVWSMPNMFPSLPWVDFQGGLLQIRCGIFTLGMEAICGQTLVCLLE